MNGRDRKCVLSVRSNFYISEKRNGGTCIYVTPSRVRSRVKRFKNQRNYFTGGRPLE